jgi:hypothetical protein
VRNKHVVGQHLVTDDDSGAVYYAAEMVRLWDGRVVHRKNQEFRHTHDFVRVKPEAPTPTMIRYDSYGSAIDCHHTTSEVSLYKTGVSCSGTDYTNLYLPRDWSDTQVCYYNQAGITVSISPTEGMVFTRTSAQYAITTLQAQTLTLPTMSHLYAPSLGRWFIAFDTGVKPNNYYNFQVAHDS